MKYKKYIFVLLLAVVLWGCNTSFGEKYINGNLEIYFTESVSQDYVVELGDYFEKNDLILDKKHSILITSDHFGFVLKMVLDDKYEKLPKAQARNFKLLEEDIKKTVFDDFNFRIEICNANFVPID